MRKLLSYLTLATLLLFPIEAFAQSSVSYPNYFKRSGVNISPINATWQLGSTTNRIAKIWATDIDTTSISIGGASMGDITMANGKYVQTDTTVGHTFSLSGYTGAAYSPLLTITNAATPTLDLVTTSTIGSAYIYRVGGTDISVADGGTGLSSYTKGALLHASDTGVLAGLEDVAAGSVLVSGGLNLAPTYSATPTVTSIQGNVITSFIRPIADGTTAIQFFKQDGTTAVIDYDTTNQQVKLRQIGVNATAYADQRSSGILNLESSMWSGSAEVKGNFTIQNIPITTSNRTQLQFKYGSTELLRLDSNSTVLMPVVTTTQMNDSSTTTPKMMHYIRNSNNTVGDYAAYGNQNQGSMATGYLAFKNTSHSATVGSADFSIWLANGGAATEKLTLTAAGDMTTVGSIKSTGNDLGWSVVAGADTACTTTCTNACVYGQNTATMAIVACSDATADVCVCAGAS